MPFNTLSWNRIRYSCYAPIYDSIAWILNRGRREAVKGLQLREGQRLLIVGCGTGLDLPYIPETVDIHLLDVSSAMLKRARRKAPGAHAMLGDAEALPVADASVDAVLLHCIVAVTPDANACVQEACRVLKPGGMISLFDKFAPDGRPVPWFRRVMNELTESGFSSIVRRREDVLAGSGLTITYESPRPIFGTFGVTLLRKP